jgi:FkbM family methyltransferase
VSGAVAAARRGITDVRLCAVEGDPSHYRWMVEHFHANGLDPTQHLVLEAAVGVREGTARWPCVLDPASDWGSRPQLDNSLTDHVGRTFSDWLVVPMVSFGALLDQQPSWDLIHMDVQGGEFDLCAAELGRLNANAHWLVIGTHDAQLHGDMIDLLFRAGWILEHERPPRFTWLPNASSLIQMTTHDGTQVWRNPHLSGQATPRSTP